MTQEGTQEGITYDRKALAVITGKTADWTELAKDVVAFASARGGTIDIGIDDDATEPPAAQRIDPSLVERTQRRIGEETVNVTLQVAIHRFDSGGEVLRIVIDRSNALPSRADGKFFLRVDDASRPIYGEDAYRLMAERSGTPWELLVSAVSREQVDQAVWTRLAGQLRASDRVKASVKAKSASELLDHYALAAGPHLTHLGILCVGTAGDRARLGTAPVIQAILYDDRGAKIGKWSWDDHALSPVDLPAAIWSTVPVFRETYEIPHGTTRQQIPAFDEMVIREVLVNALVHRPYTQRGDIYLNLHPDRLVCVNPGLLPLGVTPANILHTTVRRNEHLARLFHDLGLMEREGSGFDAMYAALLSRGRETPVLREGPDRVEVTIPRRIIKPAMIEVMERAVIAFRLTQRETIAFGLLALHDGLTVTELARHLELTQTSDLAEWLQRMIGMGIVETTGRTRAYRYFITPRVLQGLELSPATTLSRIEPHRLAALIIEDLRRYPDSAIGLIASRIGSEITRARLKRALALLVAGGQVTTQGAGRWTTYRLARSAGRRT